MIWFTALETENTMKLNFVNSNAPTKATPAQLKMLKCLRSMKDGDLLNIRDISAELGYTVDYINRMQTRCSELAPHKVIIKNKTYWGNLKTITAARKQFPNQN